MDGSHKEVVISIRMTRKLKDAIDQAAEDSGLGLMDWIRAVWARAANEGAFAPKGGHDAKSRNKSARAQRARSE